MASPFNKFLPFPIAFSILIFLLLISNRNAYGCYRSIISFGDSLADTGNLLHIYPPDKPPQSGRPPYGDTFFHRPIERYSDGRLMVDFIALGRFMDLGDMPRSWALTGLGIVTSLKFWASHKLGRRRIILLLGLFLILLGLAFNTSLTWALPFLGHLYRLYFVRQHRQNANTSGKDFSKGVNFAVGGATALNQSFLKKQRIVNPITSVSLGMHLEWFKEFFATFCQTNPDCKIFLQTSLILVGEIGGNDDSYAFAQGAKTEVIESFVAATIKNISLTIQLELIKLGAKALMVPGTLPIGCTPCFLAYYENSDGKEYDPETGCLNWLNRFSRYHNELLQMELNRIRGLYPHATIIYGDYYNAAMRLCLFPNNFGFTSFLRARCGAGGPYNCVKSATCGNPPATSSDDPSQYVCWDGINFTEAAYCLIALVLVEGPYTIPPIRTICTSVSKTDRLSEH